jgi:hypothetical protein
LCAFEVGRFFAFIFEEEVHLNPAEDVLLPFLEALDGDAGDISKDLLDELVESCQGKKVHFVVHPVGLAFVHGLYDSVVFFLSAFAVVLVEVGEVAVVEEAADPVPFGGVVKESVALEKAVLELSDVEVAVLEQFLAEAVQQGVVHVAPVGDSEFEVVFVAMGVWVVPAVAASENDAEAQSIDEPSLFEADQQLVP